MTTSIDATASTTVWVVIAVLLALGIVAAALAFWPPKRIAALSFSSFPQLPATGILTVIAAIALFAGIVLAFLPLAPPVPGIHVILGVFALALATIGGGPAAVLALRLATRGAPAIAGPNGGIIVTPAPPASSSTGAGPAAPASAAQEVLRGGTTIGILERIAVAGCVIAGFPEGIAIVVAVKGVGRFTELSTPEAKERFIIGTLASFVWACACTVIVH